MKLKKLFALMLPVLALTACSSDDPGRANGEPGQISAGYVAVKINLPTIPSTRAGNDVYEDGLANEYKVENAAIVLFEGPKDGKEEDVKYNTAYPLYDLGLTSDVDKDNITVQYEKAAKVDALAVTEGYELYALALINYNSAVIDVTEKGLLVNGVPFEGTFKKLLEITSNHPFFNGENTSATKFFMTNAPMSTVAGSTSRGTLAGTPAELKMANVKTLASFDVSKIKKTKAEAKADPAASLYVERAVAKVSTKKSFENVKIGEKDVDLTFWGWYVDNTEPTSYIVRNLGIGENGLTDYLSYTTGGDYKAYENNRFVGGTAMGQVPNNTDPTVINDNLYRIYWAKDPNYGLVETDNKLTTQVIGNWPDMPEEQKAAYNNLFKSADNIFYPHENTFPVKYQDYHNTTRAVFRMGIKPKGWNEAADFYVVNGDESNLYTKDAAESKIFAYLTGGEGVTGHNSDIKAAFDAALNAGKTFDYGKKNVVVTFQTTAEGVYEITGISLTVGEDLIGADKTFSEMPELGKDVVASLVTYLNNSYRILEYKDGNCYYEVRIMHFASPVEGDNYGSGDLAPWKYSLTANKPNTSILTTEQAYGNDDNTEPYFLGRYGLVRNNWYELEISAVKKLGSPVPPNVQGVDKADDNIEIEQHLAFKINVLSWAKRTQKVEF